MADHLKVMKSYSRTAWICRHQNLKPFWILLQQEMMELAVPTETSKTC